MIEASTDRASPEASAHDKCNQTKDAFDCFIGDGLNDFLCERLAKLSQHCLAIEFRFSGTAARRSSTPMANTTPPECNQTIHRIAGLSGVASGRPSHW